MSEPYDFNIDYLKKHYREMMSVDDVPLPLFPFNAFVPEMDTIMIDRINKEGRDSLYGRYRDGFFSREGENYIEESIRLLRLYLIRHPEHLDLLNNPQALFDK